MSIFSLIKKEKNNQPTEEPVRYFYESLVYSNYVIRVTRQSQIDTDATITEEAGFRCPRCKVEHLYSIEHGNSFTCFCKLKMTRYGNSLECQLPVW